MKEIFSTSPVHKCIEFQNFLFWWRVKTSDKGIFNFIHSISWPGPFLNIPSIPLSVRILNWFHHILNGVWLKGKSAYQNKISYKIFHQMESYLRMPFKMVSSKCYLLSSSPNYTPKSKWGFHISWNSWCHQIETISTLLAICAGNLKFSLICTWINGWVNNHEAGYLRRHRAHYDVIVMWW